MLKSEKLHPGGVFKIWPAVTHKDGRGSFTELYRETDLWDVIGHPFDLRQMNVSHSGPVVLRGMHYHRSGYQGKFLRPIIGDIFQVSVDVRADSPTFGSWVGTYLKSIDHEAVWVPPGFANGFTTFAHGSIVLYQMSDYFDPDLDCGFRWNDPEVNIRWPFGTGTPVNMSAKDRNAPSLAEVPAWEP